MSNSARLQARSDEPEIHQAGSGTPLVLLHGMGGSWRSWNPVLDRLAQRHRVIAVTLPGHLGGAAMAGEPTVAAMADILIAQLRALGLSSAHVAGNSLGGWLALELARRGFARSVVAISPAGAWRTPADLDVLVKAVVSGYRWLPIIYRLVWPFAISARCRKLLFADQMVHGDRVSASDFRLLLYRVSQCRILPRLIANTKVSGPVQSLTGVSARIRVAWCEQDKVLPFANYGQPLIDRIGAHELVVIPGVGHVPMWDDPDAVARTILQVTDSVNG
jgi:pimeloyl-ACP methyl ester carboxylesterase